jgi:quercetin dioxygenase-like cupin family protein
MAQQLNDGVLFSGLSEEGFDVQTSPGVRLRPLLTKEEGKAINVLYGTISLGKEITREAHAFSETLIVIKGTLACMIDGGSSVTLVPGKVWHVLSDRFHTVKNIGEADAEFVLLAGL